MSKKSRHSPFASPPCVGDRLTPCIVFGRGEATTGAVDDPESGVFAFSSGPLAAPSEDFRGKTFILTGGLSSVVD